MVTPSKRTWSLALMVSAPSWSEDPLLPSKAEPYLDPAQRSCFFGIKLEPVHIHPGSHISNARLECMSSSCRRFLRVTLEVESSVIGVDVESHIMCCNCVFQVRRI